MEIETNLLFALFQRKGWVTKNIDIRTGKSIKKIVIIFSPDNQIADYLELVFKSWGSPATLTTTQEYFKIECTPPSEQMKKFESYKSFAKRTNYNTYVF